MQKNDQDMDVQIAGMRALEHLMKGSSMEELVQQQNGLRPVAWQVDMASLILAHVVSKGFIWVWFGLGLGWFDLFFFNFNAWLYF